jgi:hypothetical protein
MLGAKLAHRVLLSLKSTSGAETRCSACREDGSGIGLG